MSDLATATRAYLGALDYLRALELRLEPRDKTAYRRLVADLAEARREVAKREAALRVALAAPPLPEAQETT